MIETLPLNFIRPDWLFALPLALAVPLAWRRLRRPAGDWARICDPHLLRWLSVGGAGGGGRWGAWWAGATIAVACVAMAGPSWERLPDTAFAARDARVIALDLSASMLAEDLKPNRLTQVRFRLHDLLEAFTEGQLGLVAYAGDAFVVSPLTSDTRTIANMLPALEPDIIPVPGSRADRALTMAGELLERAGFTRGEVLLITDSADAAAIDTAAALRERGIRTSVMAVGTAKGAPIPSGSGFVSDASGAVVVVRLDAAMLQRLAEAGGGRYSLLGAAAGSEIPWVQEGGSDFAEREDGQGQRWRDAGPWLTLLLLPALAFGFRRGLIFALPLVLLPGLFGAPSAQAGWWDDLWLKRDQQAQASLEEGRADEAAALAENPALAAEAWYRAGDFERAHRDWSVLDSADAHYNRGNALALAGELDAALAAYDAALARRPDMEDALYNRALVEQLKQQQEQEQEQQDSSDGEEGDASDQQQDGESSEQEQEGEGQESENEQSGEEDSSSSEQAAKDMSENWSEEDAQAMEQWLRRIPDDPGGLLRRKFRNQHLKRGAPEGEEKEW